MWFHITAETVEASEFVMPLGKPLKVHTYAMYHTFQGYPDRPISDHADILGQGIRFFTDSDPTNFNGVLLSKVCLLKQNRDNSTFDPKILPQISWIHL